jgi:hypothetical protein
MRQAGLDKAGEFSEENIVFKILRAQGYLDKLKDHARNIYDKEMTITEGSIKANQGGDGTKENFWNSPKISSEDYFWMDPDGRVYIADGGHAYWASQKTGIEEEWKAMVRLYNLGWARVVEESGYFPMHQSKSHLPASIWINVKKLTTRQKDAIEMMGIVRNLPVTLDSHKANGLFTPKVIYAPPEMEPAIAESQRLYTNEIAMSPDFEKNSYDKVLQRMALPINDYINKHGRAPKSFYQVVAYVAQAFHFNETTVTADLLEVMESLRSQHD